MQLELRQLRSFLAVAQELNFTRAAERLHLAQPALSAQIRQLERQLGCELFARTTRRVELTPPGQLLLGDASEIVTRADKAAAKLQAAARGQRGLLRLGFMGPRRRRDRRRHHAPLRRELPRNRDRRCGTQARVHARRPSTCGQGRAGRE